MSTSTETITSMANILGVPEGNFKGSGVYMYMETFADLVAGDYLWDGDYGYMMWNGKQWLSEGFLYQMGR